MYTIYRMNKHNKDWTENLLFTEKIHAVQYLEDQGYVLTGGWYKRSQIGWEGDTRALITRMFIHQGRDMSQKAVSKKFLCDPWKIPSKDRNPYIQVDIDRLIGHLMEEIEKSKDMVENPVDFYREHPEFLKELASQQDAYEGLLGMIRGNSFM